MIGRTEAPGFSRHAPCACFSSRFAKSARLTITVVTTSFLETNGPQFLAKCSLDNYRAVISKMGLNICNTFLFSFSTINELSSTVMLYTGKTATISVAIYGEIFKNGYGNAAALSSILTFITILCLMAFTRLTNGKKKPMM